MQPGHRSPQRARASLRRVAPWAAAMLAWPACAAEACSDRDERRLARLVELVVGEPGPTADAAEAELVAAGAGAILYLETGLYDAEPSGRRRIVRALGRIEHREVIPILDHLARHDPDEDVRADAGAALGALSSPVARRPAEHGPPP